MTRRVFDNTRRCGIRTRRDSGWTPANYAGLIGWWESDQGITLNGSNVSSWAAINNASKTWSQGTGAKQPAYNATDAAFNSKPSIQFDGATSPNNDGLVLSGTWGDYTTTTAGCVMLCMSIDTGYSAPGDYCWGFLVGSGLIAQRCISSGNFNMNEQMSNNTGYASGNLAFTVDTAFSCMWIHNGTIIRGVKAGTGVQNTMPVNGEHASAAGSTVTLGYLTGSTAAPPIRITAIVMGNTAASNADEAGWAAYCNRKWGTP